MKTLICIIGNICSGKSTLLESVKVDFPEFSFFSVDEYREKYKAENVSSENTAIRMLTADVLKANKVFLECVGTGAWFQRLLEQTKIDGFKIVKIKIDTKISACLLRHKLRLDANVFCYDYEISDSINYNFRELLKHKDCIELDGNKDAESLKADFLKLFVKSK